MHIDFALRDFFHTFICLQRIGHSSLKWPISRCSLGLFPQVVTTRSVYRYQSTACLSAATKVDARISTSIREKCRTHLFAFRTHLYTLRDFFLTLHIVGTLQNRILGNVISLRSDSSYVAEHEFRFQATGVC